MTNAQRWNLLRPYFSAGGSLVALPPRALLRELLHDNEADDPNCPECGAPPDYAHDKNCPWNESEPDYDDLDESDNLASLGIREGTEGLMP